MKKTMCFLLILFVAGTSFAFADFPPVRASAGLGIRFIPWWSSVKKENPAIEFPANRQDLGFYGYLDITYLMADIGATFKVAGEYGLGNTVSIKNDDQFGYLDMNLLIKLPFRMGMLTVFPAAGIGYRFNLYANDSDGNDLTGHWSNKRRDSLNQFWVKAGLGADLSMGKSFYLRPMVLFGYKIKSDFEEDAISSTGASWNTFGVDITLALGYRF